MERRQFLRVSGASAVGATALPAQSTGNSASADPIRVGAIGSGGRGSYLIGEFKEVGARVDGVCDVYEPNLQRGVAAASSGARGYVDYQELLSNPSIDAVIIATPDHWHARMLIDAVKAGKDVYIEKPLSHTIPDGFAMVEAVRGSRQIVQVGTQRRSSPLFQEEKAIIDSGAIGDVRLVTAQWLNYRDGLSTAKLKGKIDWKRWLGPAPARELDDSRFYNWLFYEDYSHGLLVGQAAHIIDCIQWFMNSGAPLAVTCAANKINQQGAETPETASMAVEFPENFLAVFTLGYQAMRYHFSQDQIKQFHGNKARFDVMREGYALYPQSSRRIEKPQREKLELGSFEAASRAHIRNFLECVRTRQEPNSPVESGLNTSIALAMWFESFRTGRRIRWNATARAMES